MIVAVGAVGGEKCDGPDRVRRVRVRGNKEKRGEYFFARKLR